MRLWCPPAAPEATRKSGRAAVAPGGLIELAEFVQPIWLAASRSPSPWPSPSGRGDSASRATTSPDAPDWRKRGGCFSLSPRERAGMRGKQRSKHQCACLLTPAVLKVRRDIGFRVRQALGDARRRRKALPFARRFDKEEPHLESPFPGAELMADGNCDLPHFVGTPLGSGSCVQR